MTFKTTRWSPDTCGCVLEYDWDDAVPQEQRVHLFRGIGRTCPDHQTLTGEALYGIVKTENETKNRAKGLLEQLDGRLISDLVGFTYDAQRRLGLLVAEIRLTPQQRTLLQAALDTAFGVGKVRLL